jgi:hypothetical protein
MYDDYDRIDARIRMAFRDIYVPPPRIPRETFSERHAYTILALVLGLMWGVVWASWYFLFR